MCNLGCLGLGNEDVARTSSRETTGSGDGVDEEGGVGVDEDAGGNADEDMGGDGDGVRLF